MRINMLNLITRLFLLTLLLQMPASAFAWCQGIDSDKLTTEVTRDSRSGVNYLSFTLNTAQKLKTTTIPDGRGDKRLVASLGEQCKIYSLSGFEGIRVKMPQNGGIYDGGNAALPHIIHGGQGSDKIFLNGGEAEIDGGDGFDCVNPGSEDIKNTKFFNVESYSCDATTKPGNLPAALVTELQKCGAQNKEFFAELTGSTYSINALDKDLHLYMQEYENHLFVFTSRHQSCAIVPGDLFNTVDVRLSDGNDVLYAPFVTKDMNIYGLNGEDDITAGQGNNNIFATAEENEQIKETLEETIKEIRAGNSGASPDWPSFRKRRVL